MKQWQVRGEVLDSDDEHGALSLGSESSSPERPLKRTKFTDSDRHANIQTEPQQRSDGRALNDVSILRSSPGEIPSQTKNSFGALPLSSDVILSLASRDVIHLAEQQPRYSSSESLDGREAPRSGVKILQAVLIEPIEADRSNYSQDRHVASQDYRLGITGPLIGHEDATSDDSSSVLSERDLSPPPGFQFLNPATQALRKEVSSGHDDFQVPNVGKRKLRTRKEIQLHPYLLDRAEYLKQCRQRGMRPVRVQEQPRSLEESQDVSLDVNVHYEQFSSPPPQSQAKNSPRAPSIVDPSLGYFDQVTQRSDSTSTPHRLPKHRQMNVGRDVVSTNSQPNVFSLPPSPARTGSQLATPAEPTSGGASPHFRLPFGMAVTQLPTPQISSDIMHSGVEDDSSSDTLPRRRWRLSAATKLTTDVVNISSSSESSPSEEPEIDIRRLRREQKRIKGVLPASWLKIDFRKHQKQRLPSPVRTSHQGSDPPAQKSPRKGIAQRIQSRPSYQTTRRELSPMSDFEGNIEQDLNLGPTQQAFRASSQNLQLDRGGTDRSQTVEDDVMENDWFDPMFAGTSRGTPNTKRRRPKQARITEVFSATNKPVPSFANERTSMPQQKKALAMERVRGKKRRAQPSISRKTPVRLSIVDAPRSATLDELPLPQFVRVALRHTRRQENFGRHSPTNKLIRMATKRDTEDAQSILQAWRGGEMVPSPNDHHGKRNDEHHRARIWRHPAQRTPLAERSSNEAQPSHSSPLRLQVSRNPKVTPNANPRRRPAQTHLKALQVNETGENDIQHGTVTTQHRVSSVQARHVGPKDTFPRAARVRAAQLETLVSEFDHQHRATVFERRMQHLTEHAAKLFTQRKASDSPVKRYLQSGEEQSEPNIAGVNALSEPNGQQRNSEENASLKVIHKRRKHRASRIDAEAREYRQPDEPIPAVVDGHITESADLSSRQRGHDARLLQGLGSFGAKYSLNFDIRPLPVGVYFQGSTFIGSGEFSNALQQSARDVDRPAGSIRVKVNGCYVDWGPWTEDVATSFNQIIETISSPLHQLNQQLDEAVRKERCEHLDRTVDLMLRSVIRYCSDHLWFADPVDRQSCCESLHRLTMSLIDTIAEVATSDGSISDVHIRVRQYCLIIALQSSKLCDHGLIDTSMQQRTRQLVLHVAESLARCTVPTRLRDLRSFYEDMQRNVIREVGVDDQKLTLTTVVLLHHTLSSPKLAKSFWQLANASFNSGISSSNDASAMEHVWYGMFTILPTLEFDSTGIARVDSRLGQSIEDWGLIRSMLTQVLNLYENSSLVRGSTINSYVRILLARCHLLVNIWGWWRCEQALGAIYDFFARRGLAFLNHEESHGSPRFIENLTKDPPLEIDADDRSFHIFLKTLATGLRGMQRHKIYDERKIGGIAWRFIPSHGRTYRKDVDLMTSDLNALRNHFDLLITLYFASPAGHRPRVELLRNLVDHNTSHCEACRLSIKAWTSLSAYQAATLETSDALRPLIEWFNDMFKSAVGQYRLARSEAEQDAELAKEQGACGIASAVVENTVAKNQRRIAATLVAAIAGLKHVLMSSSTIANVKRLSTETSFALVFEIFDPTQQRLSAAVTEAVAVVDAALDAQQKHRSSFESQHASEDSQDFGDSSALQELVVGEADDLTVSQALHNPISQFLSNVLGADECAEDRLLQRLIDVWARLIGINVERGEASWTSYIDDYSPHSWNRLRETPQKRKFTPYFMARVVEHAGHEPDIKQEILTTWLVTLVEREAVLKYQHVLTSALLDRWSDDPLIWRLSLPGHNQQDVSRLTLDDLRQCRLGLISSILSEMRKHCEGANIGRSASARETRMIYAGMLRKLMQAMKTNYQDLQASYDPKVANGNVQGAYVEFVQHVVTFLQQHSTEICPIDRFFTDSTAFPLPATDPTYVIGRLRSYAPKLSEPKTRKQLAVFVQTVSERAATDAQQAYLVDQFTVAMTSGCERGDSRAPSLRHVLLTSIFSAYYDGLIANTCDWIVALPMLEASQRVLDNLLYSIDIGDKRSVAACVQIMYVTVRCVNQQCSFLLSNHSIPWRAQTYRSVAKLLDVARACLVLASYIDRSAKAGYEVVSALERLRTYSTALNTRINADGEDFFDVFAEDEIAGVWTDTKAFAANQVRGALDNNWSAVDGHYEVRRGNSRKEIVVQLESVSDERDRLIQVIYRFDHAYDSVFDRRKRTWRNETGMKHFGLRDLVI